MSNESYSSRRVPFITIEWPGDDVSQSEPLRAPLYTPDGSVAFEFTGDSTATRSWSGDDLVNYLHQLAEAVFRFQHEQLERELRRIADAS